MKPEDVPEEWVEIAFAATREGRRVLAPGWMTRAIAAVAPLIAAAERERIKTEEQDEYNAAVQAFIAGKHVNEIRAMAADVYPSASFQRLGGRDLYIADIYAAIRARGTND